MLALIAGEGALPLALWDAADTTEIVLCEMKGYGSSIVADERVEFQVEKLGTFIHDLGKRGVEAVCFAGAIARPKIDPTKFDLRTMPMIPRMAQALNSGDDAALRIVMSFFEDAGMTIRAAHEVVPELMPQPGMQSACEAEEQDRSDVKRGFEIIAALGPADIGQACIVSGGQALAVETMGGTDWMIGTLETRNDKMAEGGLLVKACKPEQDRRIDMPTIGPDTFVEAARVGLRGVVIEAGGVQVLDLPKCVALADAHDLIFWVR